MKKAWDASEGTCVRLALLVELSGLLIDVEEVGPEKAPPILHDPGEAGEGIPLLDVVARVDGRVAEDMAEPGRLGSFDAAVWGRREAVVRSFWNSPSSEATSVNRDDMMLGAC